MKKPKNTRLLKTSYRLPKPTQNFLSFFQNKELDNKLSTQAKKKKINFIFFFFKLWVIKRKKIIKTKIFQQTTVKQSNNPGLTLLLTKWVSGGVSNKIRNLLKKKYIKQLKKKQNQIQKIFLFGITSRRPRYSWLSLSNIKINKTKIKEFFTRNPELPVNPHSSYGDALRQFTTLFQAGAISEQDKQQATTFRGLLDNKTTPQSDYNKKNFKNIFQASSVSHTNWNPKNKQKTRKLARTLQFLYLRKSAQKYAEHLRLQPKNLYLKNARQVGWLSAITQTSKKKNRIDLTEIYPNSNITLFPPVFEKSKKTIKTFNFFVTVNNIKTLAKNLAKAKFQHKILTRFWPNEKYKKDKQNRRAFIFSAKQKQINLKHQFNFLLEKYYQTKEKRTTAFSHSPQLKPVGFTRQAKAPKNKIIKNINLKLGKTKTYTMHKQLIKTFWIAHRYFKKQLHTTHYWTRRKLKNKFWRWFNSRPITEGIKKPHTFTCLPLWQLFVKLNLFLSYWHVARAMRLHLILLNGGTTDTTCVNYETGDLIQITPSLQNQRTLYTQSLQSQISKINKTKHTTYVIKRSQWREKKKKRANLYESLTTYTPNNYPSWLQFDFFSSTATIIYNPIRIDWSYQKHFKNYTLLKLTPWRVKI